MADSLSDIEDMDDTMQACEAGSAVATFSELVENGATGVLSQSCSASGDLGISAWGGRYVWVIVKMQVATCTDSALCADCNGDISGDAVACKITKTGNEMMMMKF